MQLSIQCWRKSHLLAGAGAWAYCERWDRHYADTVLFTQSRLSTQSQYHNPPAATRFLQLSPVHPSSTNPCNVVVLIPPNLPPMLPQSSP